jgi:hypothetical protein
MLVSVAGGCGSSSNSGSTSNGAPGAAGTKPVSTPRGLSHDQLIARLNKLCKAANAEIDDLGREFDRRSEAQDYQGVIDVRQDELRLDRQFDRDVAALQPGPSDRDAFDRYRRAVARLTGITERTVTAIRAEDDAAVASLQRTSDRYDQQRITAAIDLGADKCGQG